MIERLRQAISAAGHELGAAELLDVLWLARVMEGETEKRPSREADGGGDAADGAGDGGVTEAAEAAGAREAEQPSADSREGPEADGSDGNGPYADPARAIDGTAPGDHVGEAPGDPGDPNSPAGPEDPDAPAGPPRRALYAMGSQGGGPAADRARPARVPGGRALPDAQQLGRALRPLRRSRDHPHRTAIDIESTVRLAAETGFLDAVCRPEQERRWSAVLLVDRSPSMQVWGPLAAELRALLARSTVFRSVEVHLLDPEDPAGPLYGRQPAKAALTFLLTDGTSPGWRSPQAVRALAAWARGGPVAALNPLPRRLWRGTALDARPRLLAAPGAFDPVGRLSVCDGLSGERDPDADGLLALPVLHPTASALEQWAGLLTRPGVPHLIDTALLDDAPVHTPPPRPHGTAEELLTHFRGAFSPESYRLAVRLSAIRPLTTPLMQLVRAATMRQAGPTHVAEILLGGLLERTDHAPDAAAAQTLGRALGPPPPGQRAEPVYDFRPGVRELLFSGLGAEAAMEVVEAVGRSLEPYMGRLPDFPVLMGDAAGELRLHASARAFAVLASPVLERMGGTVTERPGGSAPEGTGGTLPEQRTGTLPQQRRPAATPPSRDGAPALPPTPSAALPPPPEPFFGRTDEISHLVAELTRTDGPPPCWAVTGPPGAGKTALALHVAHAVADHFPDGQVFVDLSERLPPGQAAAHRALLARRRVLVVLDGLPDDVTTGRETLAALLPGPGDRTGAVLLTARRPPHLDGPAGHTALTRLPATEAHAALPEHRLLQWLDAQLTPPARRAFCLLAVPEGDGLSLPAVSALLATPPDRARAHLDELVTTGALERTADGRYRYAGDLGSVARGIAEAELPRERREAALSRLLDFSLAAGRRLHDARYPGEWWPGRLTRVSSPAVPEVPDATAALADWADETPALLALVRRTALRAPRLLRPAADLLLFAQVTADSAALSAAFEAAARTVAVRAAEEGDDRAEGRARAALAETYAALGTFAVAEPEARRADRLAERSGDPVTRLRAPYTRGIIALHQGRHDTAERHLTLAWERCRDHKDGPGEAAALAALARLWAATGNGAEAVLFAERSVSLFRRAADGSPRRALGLYALSEALSSAGRHNEALRVAYEALPLFEEDRQRLWAGRVRSRAAEAMVGLIRPNEAALAAQDAAQRLLVPGGERWRADALTALGHAETALGRKQGAQAHWREALAVYEEFGAPKAAGLRALLGDEPGPPTAGTHPSGVSRTGATAATGTVLRDLTAAVAALRDRLRLTSAPGDAPLASLEAELTALLGDFPPCGGPSRRDFFRLATALDEAVAPYTAGRPPGDVHEAARIRHLTRRLAP
ncbi:tetratricopeptide repeat protein [Streptomyces natalensis]|uniref:AAA+ ATPase domain-containing protein n=1 Tax=Streptomyces natalensis ATCC 27448 TaxID=1240678 RepID=A0A0D7CD77_9ACTN|nr:tetratricopeptide repeat protein [Streptomyces natalensis]KIZ14001.1 hypothetical protein SNA_33270 [Streptomyces natalensis ATCC 27448]